MSAVAAPPPPELAATSGTGSEGAGDRAHWLPHATTLALNTMQPTRAQSVMVPPLEFLRTN